MKKRIKFPLFLLFICLAIISGSIGGIIIKEIKSPESITEYLRAASPLFLYISLFLSLYFLIKILFNNIKKANDILTFITNKHFIIFCIISLMGIIFILTIPPKTHRIFYDEDIYLNIGQNIAEFNKAQICNEGEFREGKYFCYSSEYNKEPNGYPFIISIIFRLFGTNPNYLFIFNGLIFGLSAGLLYLFGILYFKDRTVGILAAIFFIIIPENLKWFSTTAAEPAAAFFPLLSFVIFYWFLENKDKDKLKLFIATLAISFQMRPESFLFIIIVILLILHHRKHFPIRLVISNLALLLFLLIPHFLHLLVTSQNDWGSGGGRVKFGLEYIAYNLTTNIKFYINNDFFPIIVTIFFIIGFVYSIKRRNLLPISFWFILFWGIFIIFYAGSYNFGADDRFSLLSNIPVAIIAAFGANIFIRAKYIKLELKNELILVILLAFFQFISLLPSMRVLGEEAWQARADHGFCNEISKKIPQDSIILTHVPTIFHLRGISAAQAHLITDKDRMKWYLEQYKGGVYFWFGYWCVIKDPNYNPVCNFILSNYDYSIQYQFNKKDSVFILYKIHGILSQNK